MINVLGAFWDFPKATYAWVHLTNHFRITGCLFPSLHYKSYHGRHRNRSSHNVKRHAVTCRTIEKLQLDRVLLATYFIYFYLTIVSNTQNS